MSLFGFTTGALALGDFRRALRLLRGVDADAVELSALRETELPDLMQAAGCHHSHLSWGMVAAVRDVSHWMRPLPPVILESQLAPDAIQDELRLARGSFGELGAEVARKAGISATA